MSRTGYAQPAKVLKRPSEDAPAGMPSKEPDTFRMRLESLAERIINAAHRLERVNHSMMDRPRDCAAKVADQPTPEPSLDALIRVCEQAMNHIEDESGAIEACIGARN